MEITELKAQVRREKGKGQARRLREEGLIPAVFYGPKVENILLAVKTKELLELRKKAENVFVRLILKDEDSVDEKLSILKEVQIEPLTRKILHADFYEINLEHKFTFDVPIHLVGEPVGIAQGGELHHLKRELKISCLPRFRPESLTLDVSGLRIGDSLKVRDVKLPEEVTVLDHEDSVIAAVAAPKVATVEEKPTEETPVNE